MPTATQCSLNEEMKKKWQEGGTSPKVTLTLNLTFNLGEGTIGQPCTYVICMVYDKWSTTTKSYFLRRNTYNTILFPRKGLSEVEGYLLHKGTDWKLPQDCRKAVNVEAAPRSTSVSTAMYSRLWLPSLVIAPRQSPFILHVLSSSNKPTCQAVLRWC